MMDLPAAALRAEELAQTFLVFVDKLETQVSEHAAQATERAARYGAGTNVANRETRDFRRNLAAGSDRDRTERLRMLRKIETEATEHAPLHQFPTQLLARQGFGSVERSRYVEQLRDAGPAELRHFGTLAVINGDRILGAAVLSRVDKFPTKSRPLNATDLAAKLVGEEFEENANAIKRIRYAMQRALNAERAFVTGRTSATAKIGEALAEREIVR